MSEPYRHRRRTQRPASGSHPGGGVSMAPGRNAARIILSNLEKQ